MKSPAKIHSPQVIHLLNPSLLGLIRLCLCWDLDSNAHHLEIIVLWVLLISRSNRALVYRWRMRFLPLYKLIYIPIRKQTSSQISFYYHGNIPSSLLKRTVYYTNIRCEKQGVEINSTLCSVINLTTFLHFSQGLLILIECCCSIIWNYGESRGHCC